MSTSGNYMSYSYTNLGMSNTDDRSFTLSTIVQSQRGEVIAVVGKILRSDGMNG